MKALEDKIENIIKTFNVSTYPENRDLLARSLSKEVKDIAIEFANHIVNMEFDYEQGIGKELTEYNTPFDEFIKERYGNN